MPPATGDHGQQVQDHVQPITVAAVQRDATWRGRRGQRADILDAVWKEGFSQVVTVPLPSLPRSS
jgi:hypothetical protein